MLQLNGKFTFILAEAATCCCCCSYKERERERGRKREEQKQLVAAPQSRAQVANFRSLPSRSVIISDELRG